MLRQVWKKSGLAGSPDEKRFEDLFRFTIKKLDDDGNPMPRDIVTAIREIEWYAEMTQCTIGRSSSESAATNSLGNLADVTHWYFASFLHSLHTIVRRRTGDRPGSHLKMQRP